MPKTSEFRKYVVWILDKYNLYPDVVYNDIIDRKHRRWKFRIKSRTFNGVESETLINEIKTFKYNYLYNIEIYFVPNNRIKSEVYPSGGSKILFDLKPNGRPSKSHLIRQDRQGRHYMDIVIYGTKNLI